MPSFRRSHIILALLSPALFIVVVEVALWALDVSPAFPNRFFVFNRNFDYPEVFKRDPEVFWRLRGPQRVSSDFFAGGEYQINSRGLRGPELEPDSGGPIIAVLGNSCAFGWQTPEDSVFIRVVRQKLNDLSTDIRYQALNAGIPGYSSFQGNRFFATDIAHLRPAVTLILFAWNDQWPAANDIPDSAQQPPSAFVTALVNTISRLRVYRTIRAATLKASDPPLDSVLSRTGAQRRVSLDEFRANLQEICHRVREADGLPVLLTSPIPALELYYPANRVSPLHERHAQYNLVIRRLAFDEGIELIDLAAEFDRRTDLFDDAVNDPIHFNSRGHAFAAELIVEQILPLLSHRAGE
ncbi:MAG TPA: SGNH/GDSL hydrolase family protein [candidate division Zixibacteria bacterium]|nr:SGNH/GDSL hydrolase family protein [candidate division Zixibacteria bacterium]